MFYDSLDDDGNAYYHAAPTIAVLDSRKGSNGLIVVLGFSSSCGYPKISKVVSVAGGYIRDSNHLSTNLEILEAR